MPYGDIHEYMPNHLFVPKLFLYRNIWGVHCYGDNCSGSYRVFLLPDAEGPAGALIIPKTYANQGPAELRWYTGLAPAAKTNQLQKPKPNCGVTWVVRKHPATSESPNQVATSRQPIWKWLLARVWGWNVNSGFRNFTWSGATQSCGLYTCTAISPGLFSMWLGACQTQDCHRVISSFTRGLSAPH